VLTTLADPCACSTLSPSLDSLNSQLNSSIVDATQSIWKLAPSPSHFLLIFFQRDTPIPVFDA
jgi:hypothetical protein